MKTTKDYLIIKQLQDDLQSSLNRNNDYYTDVLQVKVGSYMWEDAKIKPAIGIEAEVVTIEEHLLGNSYIKNLHITLDLFMDNQRGMEVYEDIYKFKDDVESFIFKSTDWTYQADSVYVEPSIVYIGGDHDPVKQSRVVFFVRYKD